MECPLIGVIIQNGITAEGKENIRHDNEGSKSTRLFYTRQGISYELVPSRYCVPRLKSTKAS